jgi:uncharacterized membrane protein required for colicin V production
MSVATLPSVWQQANWADATIVVFVVLSFVLGFWSGFVWQVVRAGSWVFAFWLMTTLHRPLAAVLDQNMGEEASLFVSCLAILAGTLLVCYLIGFLAKATVNALHISIPDRILGAFLGGVKALFICGILALVLETYTAEDSSLHQQVSASPLAQATSKVPRQISHLLPGDLGS